MARRYTVILTPEVEEGGWSVTVPALPGCVTQGETREEALENAREAIAGYLEELVLNGEKIPIEDDVPVLETVQVQTLAPGVAIARRYAVLLHQDREMGGWWVSVPSLPGCFTQGATREEALEHAEEVIAGHVEALEACSHSVPIDDVLPELRSVQV